MRNRITTNARTDKAGTVLKTMSVARFRRLVWNHWKKEGRHDLPWRKTRNPYRILVSEMMLQQTQVSRVVEKYKSFLKRFPTERVLASAPLSEVLKEWSGLGYNRRAKYLHDVAKVLATPRIHSKSATGYLKCRGVGPYTRNAVMVFAFNDPQVLIETNIRTAYTHHFFPNEKLVSDAELMPIIEKTAKGQDPRQWHWALMDYGSYLKKIGVRNNSRSAHYVKQSKFEGSLRQVRGEMLRLLQSGKQPRSDATSKLALASLVRDGLVKKGKGEWQIA